MTKTITLKDIKIKDVVIHEQNGNWVADIRYVVLDVDGNEWMTETTTVNDFESTDKGTITRIINVISAKIKARKQL